MGGCWKRKENNVCLVFTIVTALVKISTKTPHSPNYNDPHRSYILLNVFLIFPTDLIRRDEKFSKNTN